MGGDARDAETEISSSKSVFHVTGIVYNIGVKRRVESLGVRPSARGHGRGGCELGILIISYFVLHRVVPFQRKSCSVSKIS